ncbi:hypothetical protein LCGC14_0266820 [marine sediment metagenome]|uniref:Uncharacterized protein n=1 Tax=marine sediment metagenome TaxID=412755 RepID=A0A0F9WKH1_9ZZZZ
MCMCPPCESCLKDIDACYGACPYCGHPTGRTSMMGNIDYIIKLVMCNICNVYHPTRYYR